MERAPQTCQNFKHTCARKRERSKERILGRISVSIECEETRDLDSNVREVNDILNDTLTYCEFLGERNGKFT